MKTRIQINPDNTSILRSDDNGVTRSRETFEPDQITIGVDGIGNVDLGTMIECYKLWNEEHG